MFVVDSNVLVYAADAACPEHGRCRARLETWRSQPLPWAITWNIVYTDFHRFPFLEVVDPLADA